MPDDQLTAICSELRRAHRVLFVTGAGISADSGLPTYRGIGGLYNDGGTDEGLAIEQVLSGPMFRHNPALTWKYIRQIEEACRGAKPNAAHHFIARLARGEQDVWVLTQNVDGLHSAAGTPNLIEIHGNVRRLQCTRCGDGYEVPNYAQLPALPLCNGCGAVMRPRVVLFEEMLPAAELRELERELSTGFDMVFSIGTTSVFPYIAAPVHVAVQRGASTVEINPDGSEVSPIVKYRVRERASVVCAALAKRLGVQLDAA